MRRVISLAAIASFSFLITGCGAPALQPHKPTIDYAKQHNLSNKDYQESEIMCISDKTLTAQEKKDIFLAASKKFHNDFSLQMCNNSLNNGLKYSPQNTGEHYVTFTKCSADVIPNFKKSNTEHFIQHSDNAYKVEFRHYKGIYDVSRTDKSVLYGYIGFEDKDNHTIVYVADGTNEEKYIEKPSNFGFIKDGVLNYIDTYPNKCKPLDL